MPNRIQMICSGDWYGWNCFMECPISSTLFVSPKTVSRIYRLFVNTGNVSSTKVFGRPKETTKLYDHEELAICRAVARTLIGGCIFIYSGSARLTSFEINSISKETSRAQLEYMGIHPPPPPIHALATALAICEMLLRQPTIHLKEIAYEIENTTGTRFRACAGQYTGLDLPWKRWVSIPVE